MKKAVLRSLLALVLVFSVYPAEAAKERFRQGMGNMTVIYILGGLFLIMVVVNYFLNKHERQHEGQSSSPQEPTFRSGRLHHHHHHWYHKRQLRKKH